MSDNSAQSGIGVNSIIMTNIIINWTITVFTCVITWNITVSWCCVCWRPPLQSWALRPKRGRCGGKGKGVVTGNAYVSEIQL